MTAEPLVASPTRARRRAEGKNRPLEVYSHGHGDRTMEWMRQRGAAEAAFLLPHLRPGMRVLDCGCGPGSITLELAARVAPGEVIGVDIEPAQLDAARALSAARQAGNVSFQHASIYDLPFPDGSFNAVLAHTVVEHVARPGAVFREVRRVLKAGGIFGVRDPDYRTWRMEPGGPELRAFTRLLQCVQQRNGGSPYYAPHQRELLLQAGFARTEAGATAMSLGSHDEFELARCVIEEQFSQPPSILAAFECGYDPAALQRLLDHVFAWGNRPDAFWGVMMCHAVGWAPDLVPT